jgi:CPA2 family monovalent cation:H+ antiporter-2
MALELLTDILIIFAIALIVGMIFNRFNVPPLVAFILTGIIVGPSGISIVKGQDQVGSLAELGIILLLFTIGLEFSFKDLWRIRLIAIAGGALQTGLSFVFFCGLALLLGLPGSEAIMMGFLFSLSSTAIVLKILHRNGEIGSPHGNIALGILIFQDLLAIPMIMAVPFLASIPQLDPTPLLSPESFVALLAQDILIVIILIACARWVMPRALYEIAKTKNPELFLLVIILTCFGVAWLVSLTGISLAIGALLAGLLISRSEYSHQAVSLVLPFRDIFTSFFFISVGMLVDVQIMIAYGPLIALIIVVVIAAKAFFGTLAPLLIGYPARIAMIAGFSLAQVGEFSFILAQAGVAADILPRTEYQIFLAVALATMAATPFVIGIGQPAAARLSSVPAISRLGQGKNGDEAAAEPLNDHLVIVGFGITGRNLARTAREAQIPSMIVELNPDLVRAARDQVESVIFGDATSGAVLEHAGVRTARIVVVAINDPVATRKIVALVRGLSHTVTIIVRTRYVSEVEALFAAGADEVVAEEFETSVEIFTVVLHKYFVPADRIEAFIREVRAGGYRMLRTPSKPKGTVTDLVRHIPGITVTGLTVEPGSALAGTTLGGINLRKEHGILVLAVRRGDEMITGLGGESRVEAGDVAIVYGTIEEIAASGHLFRKKG